MTSYTRDVVADFGAPTDGTSDASAKFQDQTTFLASRAAGDIVTLNWPAHVYNIAPGTDISVLPGVLGGLTTTVNATGATLKATTDGDFFLGCRLPFRDDDTHSSRINTVSAGATTVQLKTPSEHTRFTVGAWILVAGLDLMGFGSPMNPAFFEYRKIASKDTGTGVITLTAPLANSYRDDWPLYNPGAPSGADSLDCGGPATIYAFDSAWDNDITINGLTIDQPGQTYVKSRRVVLNGGGCGNDGVILTTAQEMQYIDFDQTGVGIEGDKVFEIVRLLRSPANSISFQSMSGTVTVTDSDIGVYNGTPRHLIIEGGTSDEIRLGTTSFGCNDTTRVNNHVTPSVSAAPVTITDIVGTGYTMSGGVIRAPVALKALPWAIPGRWCFFGGAQLYAVAFQVLAVTRDATHTIVTTSLSGGFPAIPLRSGSFLDLRSHPCPLWSGTGNSGCADIVDMSQAGQQNKPVFSYSKRPYTGAIGTTEQARFFMVGRLVSVSINVITPYTGGNSPLFHLSRFDNWPVILDDYSGSTFGPIVNPKIAGNRIITPSGVSGAQSGDTLSAPGSIWFPDKSFSGAQFSQDASGAVIEVEIITDQGISVDVPTGFTPTVRRVRHLKSSH